MFGFILQIPCTISLFVSYILCFFFRSKKMRIPYYLITCVLHWMDRIFFKITFIKNKMIDERKRYVYLANHQTFIDPIIAKKSLSENQFLVSVVISYAKYIPLIGYNLYLLGIPFYKYSSTGKGEHKGLVQMYSEYLINNKLAILAIFPEGKRVFDGQFNKENIRTGAFVIAKNTGMDIVPVYHNLRDSIDDVKKEYRANNIYCIYGAPIKVKDREMNEIIEEYYNSMINLKNQIDVFKIA